MSETAVEAETHEDDAHHPSDRDYVIVFIGLVVLTALEVATFFIDMPTAMLILALGVMMSIKFYLIIGFFMHLRVDHPHFTRLFITGLVLAVTVYLIMLSAFQFWDDFSF